MKNSLNLCWKIGNKDEIYSPSINSKGYLHDKHGFNSTEKFPTKFPSQSFQLWWKKINGAKSYVLIMESLDFHKSMGMPCINWIAANIKTNELYDNQSLLDWAKWKSSGYTNYTDDMLWQGFNYSCDELYNSKNSRSKFKSSLSDEFKSERCEDSCIYIGPRPVPNDGYSILRIYGIDVDASELTYIRDFDKQKKEHLNKPFYVGELLQAISDHIVGTWTLSFKYNKFKEEK